MSSSRDCTWNLQIVMGWENYHLHLFQFGGVEYTDPGTMDEIDFEESGLSDESKLRLSDALPNIGSTCLYRYDFGDNWEHTLLLERILDPEPGERYPVCLDGARACPPEDCGGVWGYEELLEVLSDPKHEDYEQMRTWAGENWDPEKFDPEIVNIGLPRRVHR